MRARSRGTTLGCAGPKAGDPRPLRVLLADDSAVNQKVGIIMLRRMGYEADLAANGLEVLQALERQPYDVVLMDVQMPEMDGIDASRRIRDRWPERERPWIIALTASAMKEDRDRCLEAGMDDVLSKPLRVEELRATLDQCVSLRAAAVQAADGV